MIDPFDNEIPPAQDLPINEEVKRIVETATSRAFYKAVKYVPPMADREIDTLAKIHCWEFYDSFEMDCE